MFNARDIGARNHPGSVDGLIISIINSYYFDKEFGGVDPATNWEEFLNRALWQGVAPLLYFAVERKPELNVPKWVAERLKDAFISSFFTQSRYQTELEKLLEQLKDKGIEVIILKGPVLSRIIYPDPALRPFADIDILFKEGDWGVIRALLLEKGFTPFIDYEVLVPRLIAGENYDHDFAFINQSGLKLELKLDAFDIGMSSQLTNEIWSGSVEYDFGTFKCRSLSLEHHLLQLLIHLNRHGFEQIRWFVDIALILKSEETLDWKSIISSAKTDNILAPVYFSLIYVCKLFDVKLDEHVLSQLRPSYIKQVVWNRTWPEEDIMAFNGIQEGSLLFPKKLFSKWLLPNILLTGRATQKMSYFLRRVFPPRELMEFRYSNGVKRSYAYYMAKRYGSLLRPFSRVKTEE